MAEGSDSERRVASPTADRASDEYQSANDEGSGDSDSDSADAAPDDVLLHFYAVGARSTARVQTDAPRRVVASDGEEETVGESDLAADDPVQTAGDREQSGESDKIDEEEAVAPADDSGIRVADPEDSDSSSGSVNGRLVAPAEEKCAATTAAEQDDGEGTRAEKADSGSPDVHDDSAVGDDNVSGSERTDDADTSDQLQHDETADVSALSATLARESDSATPQAVDGADEGHSSLPSSPLKHDHSADTSADAVVLDATADDEEDGGEGEDVEEDELDADEDVASPAFVPRRGGFYEHDLRCDDADRPPPPVAKKGPRQRAADRWSHDLFFETEQCPKSSQELVYRYGYDIRRSSESPEAPQAAAPRGGRAQRRSRADGGRRGGGGRGGGRARRMEAGSEGGVPAAAEMADAAPFQDSDFPPLGENVESTVKSNSYSSLFRRRPPIVPYGDDSAERRARASRPFTQTRPRGGGRGARGYGQRAFGDAPAERVDGAEQPSSTAPYPTREFRSSARGGAPRESDRGPRGRPFGRPAPRRHAVGQRGRGVRYEAASYEAGDGRDGLNDGSQRRAPGDGSDNPRESNDARAGGGPKRYSTQRQQKSVEQSAREEYDAQPPPRHAEEAYGRPNRSQPAPTYSSRQYFDGGAAYPPAPMHGAPPRLAVAADGAQMMVAPPQLCAPPTDAMGYVLPVAYAATPPPVLFQQRPQPMQSYPSTAAVTTTAAAADGPALQQPTPPVFYDPDSQQQATRPPPSTRPRRGIPIVPPPPVLT